MIDIIYQILTEAGLRELKRYEFFPLTNGNNRIDISGKLTIEVYKNMINLYTGGVLSKHVASFEIEDPSCFPKLIKTIREWLDKTN